MILLDYWRNKLFGSKSVYNKAKPLTHIMGFLSGVRVGGGGQGAIAPPHTFSYSKNIVIVVRLEIKNLEQSDFLSIKIVNFSYF